MNQPEFIPLGELLSRGRTAGYPVADGPEGAKSWDDLIREVSGWKAAFAARPETRFLLHEEDSWTFACALLGAWAAGKHSAVPGDALPATLDALALPRVREPLHAPAAMPGRLDLVRAIPGGALTVYTSGSTGKPAAFAKSFAQLSSEIESLENTFGAGLGPAAILSTVSHQHIYGLLFKILWPLCSGRVIYLPGLFYPEEILAAVRKTNTAALISSPAHLKRLPEALDWASVQDRWRAVFSSGGPLPFEGARKTRALFGRAPFEVYGSSETGGIAWRERAAESSPWRSFPKVTVELEAASGALRVRSPHLPNEGWFTTADKAKMTPDGFELFGRLDRIVKVEEKRVSLDAVEAALLGSGLAAEARVLALAGDGRLGAVVVPSADGQSLERKILQERLRASLAKSVQSVAIPKRWRFASALPLNASGKVTEDSLRLLFDARPRLPEVTAVSKDAPGHAVLSLRLPKDLFYFDGHFPGAPILPGVVQIDWAVHYAKEQLGLEGSFLKIEALKFHQVLAAGDAAELVLAYDAEKGRLKFEYRSARGRHSSGSLSFRREHV